MNRFFAPLLLALMLPACGLQPLYSGGSKGAVATTLGAIDVAPIEGKSGWLMRNALNDRLGAQNSTAAQFRLVVALDDQIEGFGVRADDTVTRERRTLRARYQLFRLQQVKRSLTRPLGPTRGST
jgi:LPS-assembly lipoprotein